MKPKKVVTIGGGTGSFVLLSGLRKYPFKISAIVSMADDGGSTGTLRDELGVLPPGDIRQCLTALSNSSEILRELMNYRFEKGGLEGHSFGNLLLSALEKIKGNFALGVEEASKILNIKGEVIPVANGDVRLFIELNDGQVLRGQKQLDQNEKIRKIGIKKVFLNRGARAYEKALRKIEKADFIIIGPGDHFGSVLPNILIKEIALAISEAKAKVIYNCNLTNKKGQTDGFDLQKYISEIEKHIGKGRVDYVIFNDKKPGRKILEKYEKREGKNTLVGFQEKKDEKTSFEVIKADVLREKEGKAVKNDAIGKTRSFIRHDSEKLAWVLAKVIKEN